MSIGDIQLEKEDRPSYVKFEIRAVKDGPASLAAGHYVSKDEEWALISALGSTDIVPKRAEKWFDIVEANVSRGREPAKHLDMYREIYNRWKKGLDAPLNGSSLKNWNALSPAQCENLINVGLRTIEDVAQAPDEAMRRYGLGIQDLKNKAKAWLQAAKDHGPLAEEVTQLKSQNKQLQGTIDSLQDQIKRMEIALEAKDAEEPVRPLPSLKDQYMSEFGKPPASPKDQYIAKFGKPPHHRMKESTIIEKLQE